MKCSPLVCKVICQHHIEPLFSCPGRVCVQACGKKLPVPQGRLFQTLPGLETKPVGVSYRYGSQPLQHCERSEEPLTNNILMFSIGDSRFMMHLAATSFLSTDKDCEHYV